MAKCKECGFFSVWHVADNRFEEAPQHYRDIGKMPTEPRQEGRYYNPVCFMQRAPLMEEVLALARQGSTIHDAILNVMNFDRPCNWATPWIQGYSAKEHREMLALADQEARHRHSLFISRVAVIASIAGVIVGACITWSGARMQVEATMEAARMSADAQRDAAKLDAEAQIRAAQMQIDSQKESDRKVPPINITVQVPPDNKQDKKKAGP